MKRFIAVSIISVLVLVGVPSQAVPWTFEANRIVLPADSNLFEIEEIYSFGESSKVILTTITGPSQARTDSCKELGVAPCGKEFLGLFHNGQDAQDVGKSTIEFRVTVPVCSESESKDFCIEDVRLYQNGSQPYSADFLRYVTGNAIPALPEHDIPAGGSTSLWGGAVGSGLESLKVAFFAQATFAATPQGPNREAKYGIRSFSLEARPYVLDASKPITPRFNQNPDVPGTGSFDATLSGCEWVDETGCGVRIDYPENVRVGASIRSKHRISEFFNGRLSDPDFKADSQAGISTFKIDALPVKVPQVAVVYPESSGLRAKLSVPTGRFKSLAYYSNSFKAIEVLREFVGDKSNGENTMWRLSSMGDLNPCYEGSGVAGLVVTNATAYGGGTPTYKDGFLDYEVAGMHYLSNGQDLFEGTYDLVIKSDVARCVYGYSNAPISATISIIGSGGEQKVATTQVSERDGWLKLSAKGFSFSENTVRAKISQKGSAPAALAPRPVAGFNMPSFTGANTKLSKAQLSSIKSWKLPSAKKVECVALATKPTTRERALGLARAKAVCAEIKKRSKNIKTSTVFGVGRSADSYGLIIINFD